MYGQLSGVEAAVDHGAAVARDAHVRLRAEECPGALVVHGVEHGGFFAVGDELASMNEAALIEQVQAARAWIAVTRRRGLLGRSGHGLG